MSATANSRSPTRIRSSPSAACEPSRSEIVRNGSWFMTDLLLKIPVSQCQAHRTSHLLADASNAWAIHHHAPWLAPAFRSLDIRLRTGLYLLASSKINVSWRATWPRQFFYATGRFYPAYLRVGRPFGQSTHRDERGATLPARSSEESARWRQMHQTMATPHVPMKQSAFH